MKANLALENLETVPRSRGGRLIVNADDWGRDPVTTDRILDCLRLKTVSSVSAMVFMEDSQRAAGMARENEIDAGLHLNLTTAFSSAQCPAALLRHQQKVAAYLLRHRLATTLFHPGLVRSFDYVVTAQLDEFRRLYGKAPERIDGHHHMHLCANVLLAGLLPAGTRVRRNFSFAPGEKSVWNRMYRRAVDGLLGRRHRLTDFFFSLPPLQPAARLQRIFSLAERFVVEVETHPPNPEEYRFLAGGEILRFTGDLPIAAGYAPGR
jgi:chitin disaccharide deacetylase